MPSYSPFELRYVPANVPPGTQFRQKKTKKQVSPPGMFSREVIGRNGRFLGRIAVRDDIDEEIPPTPWTMSRMSSPRISDSVISRHRANIPVAYSIPIHESSYVPPHEPMAQIRPVSWSQGDDDDVLELWTRGATTGLHSSDQQWVQRRENQPQNTNSPDSEVSFNGSEIPASPNRNVNVTAHLKYLVRGFLKQFRRTTSATGDRRKQLATSECYIPSPKVTFLIDKPDNLICQICRQARLKLAVTAENPGPEMIAILPCGHIACQACIDSWFTRHASCPFCRVGLTHTRCGHTVKPRLIAQDTIHSLPATLPNNGKIGDTCFKCAEKERRERSIKRWAELADEFKTARRKAERLGTNEAAENMRKAQKAFEQLPEDDFWILSRMRHHRCTVHLGRAAVYAVGTNWCTAILNSVPAAEVSTSAVQA
ncbi:hypothetical protein O1611_g8880 [Lasiodiplodia mahajangana]|uniref:Uncharacterized protein n=1 Tax=Lasiodiplodia mahajangana TaxID=1108764 RepID=A0ACC2JB81_9PEZI|nr:hypothetical protein O1611_g8880 [Lasiodiplodia mahajangana]